VRRYRDATGATAQRRLATQPCGAWHPGPASDDQHASEITLVRATATFWQQIGEIAAINSTESRSDACAANIRNLEVVESDLTAVIRPLSEKKTRFEADEGRRQVRNNRTAHDFSAITIDAGRDVHGVNGRRVRIDCSHSRREIATDRAFEAAAKHGVDQQLRFGVEIALPRHDNAAFGRKIAIGCCRVAAQGFRIDQCDNRHNNAILCRKARDNIAIPAIVARTANDLPAFRLRETAARNPHSGRRGTIHQQVSGNAVIVDRNAVDLSNRGHGVDVCG